MAVRAYSWLHETEAREHTMECRALSLRGREHELLYRSEKPTNWPADAAFEARGDAPEDVPWSCLWPLVSDRLRFLIESNGLTGATCYPVQVISRLPVPIPRYWYVHFQHLEEAINYERSTWVRRNIELPSGEIDGRIIMIKYVLKRRAIEGWDLFRCIVRSGGTSGIFCSERFRDLFIEHGCTGLNFLPVPVTE